ncbi:MAG: Y-family DNA polymerase [Chlamydiales bacterium]|nr:Y-family DNA polymerase [Chlamydiales bacterium]
MYALIDCNNFFASCEELFKPQLKGKPIVVLSNNDGCIIARSKAAKDLGIPMGAPLFEYDRFLKKHGVEIFSSNFELYSDMSRRVMASIESLGLELEPYSIDETFAHVTEDCSRLIKERVERWTGISVGVGMGLTKTQAKLANKLAKRAGGIWRFQESDLDHFPIEDVWGVGKKHSLKLKSYGIFTARDWVLKDDQWIKKHFSVVGLRTVMELRGIACLKEDLPSPKKGIVASRSFAVAISDKQMLSEAIMSFVARAARKLRKDRSRAGYLTVFTDVDSAGCNLPVASDFNPLLMANARRLLHQIYREGMKYKRAGVMLCDITADQQFDLLAPSQESPLMGLLDGINRRHGKEILFYASQGVSKNWQIPLKYKSPRYTTHWQDIPRVC